MGVGLNDIECPSTRKLGSAREQLLKQIPVRCSLQEGEIVVGNAIEFLLPRPPFPRLSFRRGFASRIGFMCVRAQGGSQQTQNPRPNPARIHNA